MQFALKLVYTAVLVKVIQATNQAEHDKNTSIKNSLYHVQDLIQQYVYTAAVYNPSEIRSNFNGKTGAERHLVVRATNQAQNQEIESFDAPEPTTEISETMDQGTSLFVQSIGILFSIFSAVAFGGGAFTVICAFTPLCTISFYLSLLRYLQGDSEQTDSDYVDSSVKLKEAFDKYTQMQMDYNEPIVVQSERNGQDSTQ